MSANFRWLGYNGAMLTSSLMAMPLILNIVNVVWKNQVVIFSIAVSDISLFNLNSLFNRDSDQFFFPLDDNRLIFNILNSFIFGGWYHDRDHCLLTYFNGLIVLIGKDTNFLDTP